MAVLIDNKQNKYRIPLEKIRKKAQAILDALDCPDGELSILIVDDSQIETLNREYLKREGPTNVLAFSMRDGEFSHIAPQLLGDVIISIDTAAREGKESGINMEKRFTQLLVHGILHLFGYDHEKTQREAREMDIKTDELLKQVEALDQ